MNLAQRLWVYQSERFPLFAHSILVLALTLGASGFATSGQEWPSVIVMAGAFVVALGSFLLLRIADEFKDAADDAAYRAYRPVPRGLVTLRQLAVAGIVVLLAQLAITLLLGWQLLPYLLAIWLLLLLMSQEFFIAEWLRSQPALYMLSHMLILPLIFLYPLAAAWQNRGTNPEGLAWFLISSYANGIIFEVGRKLRAPQDEEVGVETYSSLWGVPRATASWLLAVVIAGTGAIVAGWSIGVGGAMTLVVAVGVVVASWVAWQMSQQPSPNKSKWIERLSALWVLALYLSLGIIPHLR